MVDKVWEQQVLLIDIEISKLYKQTIEMGILFLMTCVRDWHYRSCMHIVLGVLAGHLSQKQPLRSQLLFRVFTELLNKNIATYIFLMV